MKKFLIAVALVTVFGGSAIYAQESTDPKTQVSTTVEDPFNEIKVEELPQVIQDAVAKQYEGKTVKAAYLKEADGVKTYKVTLADSEGNTTDVLLDEKGEVIPNE